MKYCIQCGKLIKNNDILCEECSSKQAGYCEIKPFHYLENAKPLLKISNSRPVSGKKKKKRFGEAVITLLSSFVF